MRKGSEFASSQVHEQNAATMKADTDNQESWYFTLTSEFDYSFNIMHPQNVIRYGYGG